MSLKKGRVVAHRLVIREDNVAVIVAWACPLCHEEHGAAWHSPTSEGGSRGCPNRTDPATGVGADVEIIWPGIPGAVSAALLEFRPDILGRSDLATPVEKPEG